MILVNVSPSRHGPSTRFGMRPSRTIRPRLCCLGAVCSRRTGNPREQQRSPLYGPDGFLKERSMPFVTTQPEVTGTAAVSGGA